MNDAREAFHDLQGLAGAGFDHTALVHDPDGIERRVARRRDARTALMSVATIVVITVTAVGVNEARSVEPMPGEPLAPTVTASAMPEPDAGISQGTDPAGCAQAELVTGKAVGNLGGLEGWFNGTPSAPCSEWEQQILDHPDTVLIYTEDHTMVEAYYRTSIDALGPYADLGPDFVVPNPDPDWPEDSLVLIDARTGEVLLTHDISELFGATVDGETEVADVLLSDRGALADRLQALASGREAPAGFRLDDVSMSDETEGDLVTPLHFEPVDPAAGSVPGTMEVRLLPGDAPIPDEPESWELDTDVIVGGSTLWQIANPMKVELGVPIGGDATLLVIGHNGSADQYLVELFAREILAE